MGTIQQRITQLRKKLKLKQKEMAQSLGVAISTISSWENMSTIPENAVISICSIFNVRREWLKTGEGDMFESPKDSNTPELIARRLGANETTIEIVSRFFSLPDEKQNIFINILNELLSGSRTIDSEEKSPKEK